jgi:hypothetical protein
MINALAVLFVAAGVVSAFAWAIADWPQKSAGFTASLIAVLAGAAMLLRGPIVDAAVDDVRRIDVASARASDDAKAIADLRGEIAARASEVAAAAAESKRLAADARSQLAEAERRHEQLAALARRGDESLQKIERAAEPNAGQGKPPALEDAPGLSARQAEVLATSLRASGAHELTLTMLSSDAEAVEFAQRLKSAIEAGGWAVHVVDEAGSPRSVVGLEVVSPVPLPSHFATLLGALGRAGLQPKGMSREEADELEVVVGSVPGKS